MKSWTTPLLVGLLSALTVGVASVEASPARVASGTVGNGSSYEVWRMSHTPGSNAFQLRVWRGTPRSSSPATCTYGFPNSRAAIAFWRQIAGVSGCPQHTAQPTPVPTPNATAENTSPHQSRSRTITVVRPVESSQPVTTSPPGTAQSSIPTAARPTESSQPIPASQPGTTQPSTPTPARPIEPVSTQGASQVATAQPNVASEILALVNAERARVGARPLVLNPRLAAAAQRHVEDLAVMRRLNHTGSDGSSVASRVRDAGYSYRYVGENIAMGYPSVAAVMNGWMNSPGHRQNILNPNYTELGVAYRTGSGGPYWVQVFGQPQ
jgi:uncharacterized protein YkwD